MSEVKEVLNERGSRYGTLKENGAISQALKKVVRIVPGWDRLGDDQREAIDNIFQKISRALSGDPNYADNWLDIEGYSNLVRTEIEGKKVEPEVRKEEKDVTVEKSKLQGFDLFEFGSVCPMVSKFPLSIYDEFNEPSYFAYSAEYQSYYPNSAAGNLCNVTATLPYICKRILKLRSSRQS